MHAGMLLNASLTKQHIVINSMILSYIFIVMHHCNFNKMVANVSILLLTGPHSAVGNVSGNRCESDCRSRGREFDPGPVPYFRGD